MLTGSVLLSSFVHFTQFVDRNWVNVFIFISFLRYLISMDVPYAKFILKCRLLKINTERNKANLRDLIAGTGLVFWLIFVNYEFFSLCDLEIWWMTSKNNRAPFLYYFKFFASFQSHQWILTGITVRKCSIRVKIGDFLSCMTLKFEGLP